MRTLYINSTVPLSHSDGYVPTNMRQYKSVPATGPTLGCESGQRITNGGNRLGLARRETIPPIQLMNKPNQNHTKQKNKPKQQTNEEQQIQPNNKTTNPAVFRVEFGLN